MCQMSLVGLMLGVTLNMPAAAKMRLSSGVRVNSFAEDLKDANGIQTLIPLEFSYIRGKFTLFVKGSYVQAELTRPQQERAELATLTDTLASVSYTLSSQPVLLNCGFTFNLPTGNEQLNEAEEPITAGEFDLRQFGEGFNAGVNVSAIKTFGSLTSGLNAAYTYRGDYTPSGEKDARDPGDQLLFAGKFNWKIAPPLKLGASAAYLHSTVTQVQNIDDFQSGDLIIVGQTIEYQPNPFELAVTLQEMLPQKASYPRNGELHPEPENGAGNTWAMAATVGYQYAKTLTVKVLGNVRLTEESPRKDAATDKPYAGRKVVYSIGPDIRYQINTALAGQVSASYFVQEKDQSATLTDDQTTTGFKLNIGMSYTF
jgi:hypothetical protein